MANGGEWSGWVYWGGTPIVFYGNGQANFEHQDWEGTERVRTTYNGQTEGTFTSLPFGDGYSVTGSDWDPYHFAGLDRDSSSATDHATFRQYGEAAGSWMSPDPYSGSYDFTNPQSLNRYAYVLNNPMVLIDPSGLAWQYDPGQGCFDYFDDQTQTLYGCLGSYGLGPSSSGGSSSGAIDYGGPGGRGGGGGIGPNKRNVFVCASEAPSEASIASGLQKLPGLNTGSGQFITDALAGNAFSGITDLATTFITGETGKHSAFYNMGEGLLAGPTQGFNVGAIATATKGTPWSKGPVDVAMEGVFGEYATGIGEFKLAYDFGSWMASVGECLIGTAH